MASIWSILVMVMVLMGCHSSSLASPASQLRLLPTSTISAAPALLPNSPLSSPPTLSPDITPLFPGGAGPSPSESSLPTIPSSPSPPNPGQMGGAPEPSMGISPSGSSPSPFSVAVGLSGSLNSAKFLGLMAFWLIMQLLGLSRSFTHATL